MPIKKTKSLKSPAKKSAMYRIGGQIGHLAHEVAAGKDQLVALAGNAIESVKKKVKTVVASKKAEVRKAAKPAKKKAAKKITKKKASRVAPKAGKKK